ncbi:MAG: SpoIIE family protein phosphatase, partial [Bacteroidales bacterium]|nr:SpoIIE family protein phosphatase [Bacteroidales bacterium]
KKVSVPLPSYAANAIITDLNDNIWASTSKGILNYDRIAGEVYCFSNADGVPNNRYNNRAALRFDDNTIVFGTAEGILLVDCKNVTRNKHHPSIKFIESIHYIRDVQQVTSIEDGDTITIQPQYKNARIIFSLLDYTAPNKNTYQYTISRRSKPGNWEHLYYQNYLVLDNYPAGLYHLKIKGHNNHGTVSKNITELYVIVKAPFWKSRIALGVYFILLIMLIYLVVVARTRQLQRLNSEYREKERIAKKIQLQKEELTLKNKSITDSINYARRIQMAMMPSLKTFSHFFPDSFVLYLPKDIVSGDFYWINEVEDRIFFSAVDCTGHGVPGAFMSIIGFELFRRITETEKIQEPASILNHLSQNIRTLFSDEDSRLHDGMDLAFCSIDKNFKTLQFSGAFNPLYIIRNNSIIEHKGNRFSVGWNGTDDVDKEFINHTIPLQPGDVIYIFTDGYADQFGGPEGKKYKYRRFRHLLLALHQLSMDRQEEFLKKSILEWKGDLDQVDDILVIGIRVPSKD